MRPEAPAFAPPATRGGSAEPSEADLLAALKSKRDELLRMQQAIKQLEGMGPTGQEEEEVAEDIDYGEEDFEQDDDDDEGEEPGSQEEWLQKLMQQQRELLQLRSAIELAKRGSNQEEEEEEEEDDDDDDDDDDDEYDDDEGQVEERDEDGPGVQGVLANLLAKKQELAELLTLKASLEKQLLQQEGESDDDDDGAEEPVARIPLASARPSTRPLSAPPSDHPRARVPEAEFDTSMAEPGREGSTELRAVLEHRRRAQQAVTEQERKIAELSALQERLRSRLADLEDNNQEDDDEDEDEEDEEEEEEDDDDDEPTEGITGEQLLNILAMKTRECQQLAAAVEQARESGMDERDPRLAQAEATLAYRYDEVKELAAIAARHGLSASGNGYEEDEEEEDDDETDEEDEARMRARERELQYSGQGRAGRQEAWGSPREDLADLGAYEDDGYFEQQQALRKRWGAAPAAAPMNRGGNAAAAANPAAAMQAMEDVQRLEEELQACTEELRAVDSQTSRQVARHPAFQSMRQSVVDRLLSLQGQLDEAKGHYEDEMDAYEAQRAREQPERRVAQREQAPEQERGGREQAAVHEAEMVPLLRDALDKLWDRPYEARVFTLQLLQGLADLEDRSLCMMCSCFARYLEKHSEPVE